MAREAPAAPCVAVQIIVVTWTKRARAGPRVPHAQAEFPSARYPNLEAIVRAFLAQSTLPVDQACFAVAGPVIAGRAKITNLPWVIDAATLRQELHLGAVALLNDL